MMRSMKKPWILLVYAVIDPSSGDVRYVGKSSSGMLRPKRHFLPGALKAPKYPFGRWLKKMIESGERPEIRVLEELGEETDRRAVNSLLNDAEVRWIKTLREQGCNLLNLTNGGDGSVGQPSGMQGKRHSEETKERIRASRLGVPRSDETKAKIKNAFRGQKHSAAARAKMSEAATGHTRWAGRKHSTESIEKMRASHSGKKHSAETRAKMRISHLKRNKSNGSEG